MQRFDSVENAVGILSYASSVTVHPGFAAVLKARYSDFLVHEGTNEDERLYECRILYRNVLFREYSTVLG